MIIPARIPRFIEWLFPRRVWQMPKAGKTLYLTFDDGPHPDITPRVLALLEQYNAKATFFCIGDRVKKYPDVFKSILEAGHAVGNHTQHHLKGTKTSLDGYLADLDLAAEYINSQLFRPPYGRMNLTQQKSILARGYQIIMWTILSADYDRNLSVEEVTKRASSVLSDGYIYLFHDSEKAEERMFPALKNLLEMGQREGYVFETIGKI